MNTGASAATGCPKQLEVPSIGSGHRHLRTEMEGMARCKRFYGKNYFFREIPPCIYLYIYISIYLCICVYFTSIYIYIYIYIHIFHHAHHISMSIYLYGKMGNHHFFKGKSSISMGNTTISMGKSTIF